VLILIAAPLLLLALRCSASANACREGTWEDEKALWEGVAPQLAVETTPASQAGQSGRTSWPRQAEASPQLVGGQELSNVLTPSHSTVVILEFRKQARVGSEHLLDLLVHHPQSPVRMDRVRTRR
jgi:hypothetical protein